jgi:hypothetical protein
MAHQQGASFRKRIARQQRWWFGNLDADRGDVVPLAPREELVVVLTANESADTLKSPRKRLRTLFQVPRFRPDHDDLLPTKRYVCANQHSGVFGTLEMVQHGPEHASCLNWNNPANGDRG